MSASLNPVSSAPNDNQGSSSGGISTPNENQGRGSSHETPLTIEQVAAKMFPNPIAEEPVKEEKEAAEKSSPVEETQKEAEEKGDILSVPEAEKKDDASKTEEAPKGEKVVPEKYELALPKDTPLEAEHIRELEAYAKEKGFTNEEAQSLLERESSLFSKVMQSKQEYLKTKQSVEWMNQIKADKEFGGDNFNRTAELAKNALKKYADKDLIHTLNDSGLGNHPSLVKMFARIGKASASDQAVHGSVQAAPSRKALHEVMFPEMEK